MSQLLCVLTRSPRTKAGLLAVPFYFQTAPIESFGFDTVVDFSDYDTLGGTRFSRVVSKALSTYSFETMFADYLIEAVPAALHTYLKNLPSLGLPPQSIDAISTHDFFSPPWTRVAQLRHIQQAKTPFILTMADASVLRAPHANRTAPGGANELSVEVTLRSVHSEERAGEPDSVYVQVSFVDFQTVQLGTVKRGKVKGAAPPAGTPGGYRAKLTIRTLSAQTCTVARIAKLYFGDASKTKPIYAANNPWLLKSGIEKDENLRAIANGTVAQTTRMVTLRKLLAKHPQILVPNLPPLSAGTREAGPTYVGES